MAVIRALSVVGTVGMVLAVAVIAGCLVPAGPGTVELSPDDARLFAPMPIPPGFDGRRARLTLAEIAGDPPAPAPPEGLEVPQLPPKALEQLEEARRLFAEHRYTETVQELEKALRYAPDYHEAHRMMALACLLSGSEARAELSANRALAIKPDDLQCHYVLARLAEKAGKAQDALSRYRIVLKCKPDELSAPFRVLTHYYLGLLLEREGYYAAAVEQLKALESGLQSLGDKVTEQNPELATIAKIHRTSAAIRMSGAQELLGEYGPAADSLALAVRQSPKDFELRHKLIRTLVLARRIDAAAAEASRFVADASGDQAAVRLLLAVHRVAGRPRAGVAAMKEILAQQPDNVQLSLLYAEALLSANQYSRAVQTLKDLLERHPDDVEVPWKLIELHRTAQDWHAWLWALSGELAARPAEYIRASQELGRINAATASRLVDEGLTVPGGKAGPTATEPPDDATASALDYLLGRLCDRLDRMDEARRLFERSRQRRAGFLPATLGEAELYVNRCRWHEATRIIEAAAAERNEPAHQLERLLGRCYEGLDDVEQAVAHYAKAIELNRADVHSLMLLGGLYDRTGQRREARLQYQAIIAVDNSNMAAREALVRNCLVGDVENRALAELGEMQRLAPNDPATIRCSALLRFLQDRDREAYCQTLRRLIQVNPDDPRSCQDLAETLFAFRDYAAARVELAAILKRDPRSPGAGELMAVSLMKLLEFEQAARQFQQVLELYPNREAWISNFAELRLIEQNYDAAVELYKRLLSLETAAANRLAYRMRLVEAYCLGKRMDQAREAIQNWLTEEGLDDPTRMLLRGLLLATDRTAGDYDQYLARCRQWLEAEPKNARLRGWFLGVGPEVSFGGLGSARPAGLIGAKRVDEAVMLALEWLAEEPASDEVMGWLADVLQSARRFDEAVEVARNRVPTEGRADVRLLRLYALQQSYARAGRYDEAVATAKEWVTLASGMLANSDPGLSHSTFREAILDQRRLAGTLLSQAGRHNDAIAHLKKMIEEEHDEQRQAYLLRALSFVHQRQERMDLAEQCLREAYRRSPTDVGLNNDFGYVLADAGKDLAEAERMVRVAVGENPRLPAYLDSLGWVLYKQGKLAEARTWLTRAVSLEDGEDAVVFDHLGDTAWRLGGSDEAVRNWRRSLEVYQRQVADRETEPSEKLVERVKGKLEAARTGGSPEVAPTAQEAAPGETAPDNR